MHITMVKKRLATGEPCRKCVQAEELLRKRELWERIDQVIWADETDADSAGMVLARQHGVEVAPFYIVRDESGTEQIYLSALKLIKERLSPTATTASRGFDLAGARELIGTAPPLETIRFALESFGAECAIAFSGADDVVLIDLAVQTGLPFSVIVVDTGRLHAETYRFIDEVRKHYAIEMQITSPIASELESMVARKGLFSFYEDGHKECCQIRKVDPLRGGLRNYRAWMTGQRKDQNLLTRGDLEVVELDGAFEGSQGGLVKFNPIANWSRDLLWQYIRDYEVPHNRLHHQGFASIGCEPCTRAVLPGQHEREGRWWWEDALVKECGLHVPKDKAP